MKLYIPDIGDIIKLKESWTFNLHHERRNQDVLKLFGYDVNCTYGSADNYTKVTFPVDTELKVQRIYIRKGSGSYSSLTFSIHKSDKTKKKLKFWAKLKDVNRIELESSATLGVLKFHIKWNGYDMPEKGTRVYGDFSSYKNKTLVGSVNGVESFVISVADMDTEVFNNKWEKNVTRINKIKYNIVALVNDEELGQWSTISTMKKKANDFIKHNKKYFVDDEQKIALREEKFERILKDETL